jgi:nucleotide-binding universal stress UspA family protein
MMKVLVPIDGSENSLRAVERAVAMLRDHGPFEVHVLNVQPPLGGDVTTFIASATVKDYHREEGEKVLQPARALLDRLGVPYKPHITVGPAGESIAGFARKLGVNMIVMGTRGLGGLRGALLGSVSTEVIRYADVPVTLVK